MDWTEQYLAAALRSIPEPKRGDVERELRSSIEDGIEERVTVGQDRAAAERAVLESLGDPVQLAVGYAGRPNYLIGPELFALYRRFIPRLLATAAPIAAIVMAVVTVAGGGSFSEGIAAAVSGAINAIIGIAFWATISFIFLERAHAFREARTELVVKPGRWTLEHLPAPPANRISATEAIGEAVTVAITIGGLLFLRTVTVAGDSGAEIPLLDATITNLWLPILLAVLGAQAVLQVFVLFAGRWTMELAAVFAALGVAFALPVVGLALNGRLINPAFSRAVGDPRVGDGDGPLMLAVAVFTTLVTALQIVSAFRRARRARGSTPLFGTSPRPA